MTWVTLNAEELEFAALVGARRNAVAMAGGFVDRYADADGQIIAADRWGLDINAAAAEMAVAKAINRFWTPSVHCQPKSEGDVGRHQVRSTRHENGCLLIRPDDNPMAYFVLAIGAAPTFRIPGYILAADAQRDEWRRAPNGRPAAWFVPQSGLTPIGAQPTEVPDDEW